MQKITINKVNKNILRFLSILLVTVIFSNCSSSGKTVQRYRKAQNLASRHVTESPDRPWRPTRRNSIPYTSNRHVKKWVKLFNGRLRGSFKKWMGRIGMYGPTIEKVLEIEKAPRDLIYLSMIESGFNLTARSHASAVGPWQFISSTGKLYGLKNDFFGDDRRDLIKSTQAAARHLKDLYKTYGDWYLSFAAYNAGPGTVNRAIRRTGSKNYWRLARSRYLRNETKNYVPKILAALHIVKNYKKYGYTSKDFKPPMQYDRVIVPDATDITVIAKSAGTSPQVIKALNPALVSGITRPDHRIGVFIPKGTKSRFVRKYRSIPASRRVSNLLHKTTSSRESLTSIAKLYGISRSSLSKLNKVSPTKRLPSGKTIVIPTSKRNLLAIANRLQKQSSSSSRIHYYRVRRGDTLSRIASRHKVSTRKLAKWNRIRTASRLRIGQKLRIYKRSRSRRTPTFAGLQPIGTNKKVSGVAHIIIQDTQNPIPFEVSSFENESDYNEELPKMIAVAETIDGINSEEPSVIKTGLEDEIEKIQNAQKTIYHKVKRGETLSHISAKYGVSVKHLMRINGFRSTNLKLGQTIKVKTTTNSSYIARSNRRNLVKTKYHKVRSGESLWSISKKYKVNIADIKKWNRLKSNNLKLGQKLKLNSSSANSYASSNHKSSKGKVVYHKVRSGDSLWGISKKYKVNIADIKKWNRIKGSNLKLNQNIKILRNGGSNRMADAVWSQ